MLLPFDTVEAFALRRNTGLSFPFLKENGELLSIAANSGLYVEPKSLALYTLFYEQSYEIYQLYPQFSRFILGITLDLETLGHPGTQAKKIAEHMLNIGMLDFETSDTRRLETLSMFERLGMRSECAQRHKRLALDRVTAFTSDADHFTRLNKPLFYELTHLVFFLSDYGRKAMPISTDIHRCLIHAGVLAYLDDDFDLLAEVCVSLSFISAQIPKLWQGAISKFLSSMKISFETHLASALNPSVDEYHPFLVSNWFLAISGGNAFSTRFNSKKPNFCIPQTERSVLSAIATSVHEAFIDRLTPKAASNMIRDQLSAEQQAKISTCCEQVTITNSVLSSFSMKSFDYYQQA